MYGGSNMGLPSIRSDRRTASGGVGGGRFRGGSSKLSDHHGVCGTWSERGTACRRSVCVQHTVMCGCYVCRIQCCKHGILLLILCNSIYGHLSDYPCRPRSS